MLETYNLIINAGVAGVFAVFALVMTREFIKHIDKKNSRSSELMKHDREQRDRIMKDAMNMMADLNKTLSDLTLAVRGVNGKDNEA